MTKKLKRSRKQRDMRDMQIDEAEMMDDIDAFHNSKTFVNLDTEKDVESSSADDEIRGVLDLEHDELSDSTSDEDDQEDYDEEDQEYYVEEESENANDDRKKNQKEQHEKELLQEEAISKNWGKYRKSYYGADTENYGLEEDAHVAKEEEEECIRLQNEWLIDIEEQDFHEHIDIIVAVDEEVCRKKKKTHKTSRAGDILQDINVDLTSIQTNLLTASSTRSDTAKVEQIVRDFDNFTKEQKLDIVLTNSPELLGLMHDLRSHISTFKQQISAEGKTPFLQLRFRLLLNYCTNICFYLMLKAEGKFVKIHPVIDHLIKIRGILEKYEIDKDIGQILRIKKAEKKKMKKKLVDKQKKKSKKNKQKKLQESKLKEKKRKKKIIQEKTKNEEKPTERDPKDKGYNDDIVKVTFRPGPMGLSYAGNKITEVVLGSQASQAGLRINWIITHVNKKRQPNNTEHIDEAIDKTYTRDKPTVIIFQKISSPVIRSHPDDNLEMDDIMQLMETETDTSKRVNAGMAYYEKVGRMSKKAKEDRKVRFPNPAFHMREKNPDVREERRRKATKKTLNFRGIVRHRRKDRKNPRVRNRVRYEKAMIKRRSVVQEHVVGKQSSESYHGQATGIKKTTIKSRKIK